MRYRIGPIVVALALYCLFRYVPVLLTTLLLFTDSLAHGFQWVGVENPNVGWVLLGVLGGALTGAYVGMRRSGLGVTPRKFGAVLGVFGAALLVAGSRAPVQHAVDAPGGDTAVTRTPMYVLNEAVRLRVRPNAESRVVRAVPAYATVSAFDSNVGGWVKVETRGSPLVTGWVRRSRLTANWDDARRLMVAERRPPSGRATRGDGGGAAPAETSVSMGEVQLDPVPSGPGGRAGERDSARDGARDGAPDSAPVPRASGMTPPAPPPTSERQTVTPGGYGGFGSGGYQPAEPPDRQTVDEVRTSLAGARASAGAGDFAAALRALALADEGVAIAVAKVGAVPWVADLRRQAGAARTSIRYSCERAAATAASRGDKAPVCE